MLRKISMLCLVVVGVAVSFYGYSQVLSPDPGDVYYYNAGSVLGFSYYTVSGPAPACRQPLSRPIDPYDPSRGTDYYGAADNTTCCLPNGRCKIVVGLTPLIQDPYNRNPPQPDSSQTRVIERMISGVTNNDIPPNTFCVGLPAMFSPSDPYSGTRNRRCENANDTFLGATFRITNNSRGSLSCTHLLEFGRVYGDHADWILNRDGTVCPPEGGIAEAFSSTSSRSTGRRKKPVFRRRSACLQQGPYRLWLSGQAIQISTCSQTSDVTSY